MRTHSSTACMTRSRGMLCCILAAGIVGGWHGSTAKAEPPVAQIYRDRELRAPTAIQAELQAVRTVIAGRKLRFHVGYTGVSDRDVKSLCGDVIPPNIQQIAIAQNNIAERLRSIDLSARADFVKIHPGILPELQLAASPNLPSWDWRTVGKVTPVRHQNCGDCWAYGVIAALESSYLIRNGLTSDESEMYLVTNSGAGNCEGGDRSAANAFLVAHGTTDNSALPDAGVDKPAVSGLTTPYSAIATGFVDPTVDIPSVSQLKKALCEYGPLSVSVNGGTTAFKHYTDGVFDEFSPDPTDHAVTLIGWDNSKQAWLIKNSWGTTWGDTCGYGTERGYMWIAWGCNKIGRRAQWIQARNKHYVLPPVFGKVVLQYNVLHHFPMPMELRPEIVIPH